MKTLRSFVAGSWHQAATGFVPLIDPSTEEVIGEASSEGVDFAAALEFARTRGGSALRELAPRQRGELLRGMSKALHARRDELIELSLLNTGATRRDAKFDLDGATGTLSYYAYLAEELEGDAFLLDGEGVQLGRSPRFWGQHILVSRAGVAVHINAFNFPAWGFAEKAACALLAGMPIMTKPATSSSLVTERCVEIVLEANVLPLGALSLICGATGDLLDRLGPQDVLAFTGSAATARQLRGKANLLSSSTRVNIEADSLNAAVLGPDIEPGSDTWNLFFRDVEREMTQKSGQKCTAVRRILVPRERLADVRSQLAAALERTVVGNPRDASVTMGPLATAAQLADATEGVARLCAAARIVLGRGVRVDGVGSEPGKGYFFPVTLLEAADPTAADAVHEHEVFGPVATLLPYDGSAEEAADLIARGGGTLVSSAYSDDLAFLSGIVTRSGCWSGRVYLGSAKVAEQLPGSGVALPQLLHGGPGRAGGGEELGAWRGLHLYLQRVGVTGDRPLVDRVTGAKR